MKHDESRIQAELCRYLSATGLLFFSVPNEAIGGGRKASLRMARFKAMGLRPGVADLVIISPLGFAHFVEVKDAIGRLLPAQKVFRDRCIASGFPWAVVRSLDDMVVALTKWGLA